MYELLLIIPLFFAFTLYSRIVKIRSFDHIGFILTIWLVASFCGYLYSTSNIYYQGKGKVTIGAIIYMLVMFYITMQPIKKARCSLPKTILLITPQ